MKVRDFSTVFVVLVVKAIFTWMSLMTYFEFLDTKQVPCYFSRLSYRMTMLLSRCHPDCHSNQSNSLKYFWTTKFRWMSHTTLYITLTHPFYWAALHKWTSLLKVTTQVGFAIALLKFFKLQTSLSERNEVAKIPRKAKMSHPVRKWSSDWSKLS